MSPRVIKGIKYQIQERNQVIKAHITLKKNIKKNSLRIWNLELYGPQKKILKTINRKRTDMNEFIQIGDFTEKQRALFAKLYGSREEDTETYIENNEKLITEEEINNRIKTVKKIQRRPYGIHNEQIKYGKMR